MIQKLEMTVLIDNVAEGSLVGEWGLSIMIDADDMRILLDTGASGLFAQNADCLNIDLESVDIGVLSHAHYDHSDGLDTFFSLNNHAPFLIREGTCENCFGIRDGKLHYIGIQTGVLKKHESRIQYVRGIHEIEDGIWLVPHRRADYSAIADIHDMLGQSDVCAYVGGLHLYKMTDGELDALCEEIRHTPIQHIFTGHCTGDHAFQFLKEKLGDRIEQFSSGYRYCFDELNCHDY